MEIQGTPAGIPAQRLVHGPVVVLHFRLSSCVGTGIEFCKSVLRPYYSGVNMQERLMTDEICFDLKTAKGQISFESNIKRILKELAKLE